MIALACRNLPDQQRTRSTLSAIVLTWCWIAFAVILLDIPFLKCCGGMLLLWIGAKLMQPDDDEHQINASDKLWTAVKTIIVSDAVMSIDNVIAIAGAAEAADPRHRFTLVVFGLIVSIPLIVWGSTLVLKLLDRFPVVVMLGAGLRSAGSRAVSSSTIPSLIAGRRSTPTSRLTRRMPRARCSSSAWAGCSSGARSPPRGAPRDSASRFGLCRLADCRLSIFLNTIDASCPHSAAGVSFLSR